MSFESVQGAVRLQIEQSSMGRGRQFGQIGPSAVRELTMRDSPQTVQVSRLAGSLIRQFGHSGRPRGLAGGRFAPSTTAYAFFDAGLGDAVAADPLPIQRFVDADNAVAAARPPARAGAARRGPDGCGEGERHGELHPPRVTRHRELIGEAQCSSARCESSRKH